VIRAEFAPASVFYCLGEEGCMSDLRSLEPLLRYDAAAEVLAVSVPKLKLMVYARELPTVCVGKRSRRFEPAALREFIARRTIPSAEAEA